MVRSSGVVLISGASTGIGRAAAVGLAREGFQVLGGVRRREDGETLVEGGVEPVLFDVTDADSIAAVAAHALDRGDGHLTGLVNNAGASINGPFEVLTIDDWRRQFEVNFFGHVAVTRAVVGGLRSAGGRIVNVGSIGGRVALPLLGPYTASKFAIHGWSESLRMELAPDGVRVALVEPGAIATEIWRKGNAEADAMEAAVPDEVRTRYAARLAAVRRASTRAAQHAVPPERVAKVIIHALTARRPRARYLVGPDARLEAAVAHLPAGMLDRAIGVATGVPR